MSGKSIVLRPAAAADVAQIGELERASFTTDRLSRRSIRRLVASPSAFVLVAAGTSRIVSVLILLFRRGAGICRLYSLAVDPAHRNHGLGGEMLRHAEGQALRQGARAMRFEVRGDNRRALNFYEQRGFRRCGLTAGYYEDGETAIRYEKPLGGATA